MDAKTRRNEAIMTIVSNWISQEDDGDLGKLIRRGSFSDLLTEVEELRPMGRAASWIKGVDKWIETIKVAHMVFTRDNIIPEILDKDVDDMTKKMWDAVDTDFTQFTRREFQNLLKWAINQGSTYAWNI